MNYKKETEIIEDILDKISYKLSMGYYEKAEALSRIYMNLKIGIGGSDE